MKKTASLPLLALPLFLGFAMVSSLGCSYQITPREDMSTTDMAVTLTPPPDPDLRALVDLISPADLAGPCAGKAGLRICTPDRLGSGACQKDESFVADRICTGQSCLSGYCQPPAQKTKCFSDAQCPSGEKRQSCQAFTNLFNMYEYLCAPAPGTGDAFSPCERGSDCIWNICHSFGAEKLCVKPCKDNGDCATGTCGPLEPFIEGFKVTNNFCIK